MAIPPSHHNRLKSEHELLSNPEGAGVRASLRRKHSHALFVEAERLLVGMPPKSGNIKQVASILGINVWALYEYRKMQKIARGESRDHRGTGRPANGTKEQRRAALEKYFALRKSGMPNRQALALAGQWMPFRMDVLVKNYTLGTARI